MEWMTILNEIFQVCIIPLLGVLTGFIIVFVKKKINEAQEKINNEMAKKYLDILEEVITNCVLTTNQTYVNQLKNSNAFDINAQKEAFSKTYLAVMNTLNEETQKYLADITTDVTQFITEKIEATVAKTK